MPTDPSWRVLLVVALLALLWVWDYRQHPPFNSSTVSLRRLLLPRTPEDCPLCRQQAAPAATALARPPLTPWSAVKSRRGAPKRSVTQGFACPNPQSVYYRITDAHLQALVGDGIDGRGERIETLRCQACGSTFSTRRATPLYRLKTACHRVAEGLSALAEGLSVAAATRVFGHRPATITTWVRRAGAHSALVQERLFQRLQLPHLQLDELRTRLRSRTHGRWLWLARDPLTKIIPVLQMGGRTQAAAHAVVHELHGRLAYGGLPVFTSDGLNLYFYALRAHFGQWVTEVGRRARQWLLRGRAELWPGQETVSAATAGRGHVGAALWDARGAPVGSAQAGPQRKAEQRLCRARHFNGAPKRGSPQPLQLVDDASGSAAPAACGVVAGVRAFRAATCVAAGAA